MAKRIVLTGGGSAGHVTPNLALIPHLQREGWEVHYVGMAHGIEVDLLKDVPDVTYHVVKSGKLRRYFDLKNFTDPLRVIAGAAQAASLMGKLKPDVVFAKGGFVSVPVVVGARMHGIPVVMHESDITPGLANRLCKPFAHCICTTFPECAKLLGHKGVQTGTPLRAQLFTGTRERGLALCGFSGKKPVLMMMGGSLGAQAVNEILRDALDALLPRYDVLHVCGKGNLDTSLEGKIGYRQFEYLSDEMPDALACADIMLSRAGSNALSEILALKKPALLVPYPSTASRGDQILNAQSLERRSLAHVIAQESLTGDNLPALLDTLYENRSVLISAMAALPESDGTAQVLAQIHRYARKQG